MKSGQPYNLNSLMLKKNYVIFTHSGNLEMSNTCCIYKDVMNMGNFLNVDIKPLCYTI